MSPTTLLQEIPAQAQTLLDTVMGLYNHYLDLLERYIETVPDTETQLLMELEGHLQEVQAALEHDMGVFDLAIQSDREDLHRLKDELRINEIYKQLRS